MMNDAVLETLKKLVTRNAALYRDLLRLEGFLRDYAAEHKREVNVLVTAAREGVPAELLKVSGSEVPSMVVDRLVRRLYDHAGMDQALARWAVAGWAAAFGKTVASGTPVYPPSPPAPFVTSPVPMLWDVATVRLVRTLEGHLDGVTSVAFAPDGRLLASGSWDKTVRLWEAPTGRLVRTLEGPADRVMSVAFAPDGRLLASGSSDKTIRLRDVQTGDLLRTLEGHTSRVNIVAFSPDGRLLASGSGDNTVRLWGVAP